LRKKSHVESTFVPCAREMCVILKEKTDAARKKLIPAKSGERYHKEMEIFRNWRQINGVQKLIRMQCNVTVVKSVMTRNTSEYVPKQSYYVCLITSYLGM
jgi:hypothetical protein